MHGKYRCNTRWFVFLLKTLCLSLASLVWNCIINLYEKYIPFCEKQNDKTTKILVVQLGGIGDYILSTPLLAALKEHYGNRSELYMIVNSLNRNLCDANDCIDKTIIYNSHKYDRSFCGSEISASVDIPEDHFDLAIWLRGDFQVFKWIYSRKIPIKCIKKNYNPLRWSWLPLITKKRINRKASHFVKSLDYIWNSLKPPSSFPCQAFTSSKCCCAVENERKIFVHIAPGNKLREWPIDRFLILFKLLLDKNNDISINMIGERESFEKCEIVKQNMKFVGYAERVNNLCGKVPLEKLSILLYSGTLYIGCDSGPMHIAAASGIPIVTLLGPQSPDVFGPRGKQRIKSIYKYFFCSPCWQFSCLLNEGGPGACLLAIKPEEVFREAQIILDKR